MDTISDNAKPSTAKHTFWRNQFAAKSTLAQTLFDLLIGVVAPVVLVLYDPMVFNFMLIEIRVFCLAAVFNGILVLATWLGLRRRLGLAGGFIAGGLLFSSLFAVYIAFRTIPLFVMAIIMGVIPFTEPGQHGMVKDSLWFIAMGGLALVPTLTAFVFIRNCYRSCNWTVRSKLRELVLFGILALLGLITTSVLPAITQDWTTKFVSRSVDLVVNGDQQAGRLGIENLQRSFWCTVECYDGIVLGYMAEDDPDRQSYLALAYHEITGDDIQPRVELFSQERD